MALHSFSGPCHPRRAILRGTQGDLLESSSSECRSEGQAGKRFLEELRYRAASRRPIGFSACAEGVRGKSVPLEISTFPGQFPLTPPQAEESGCQRSVAAKTSLPHFPTPARSCGGILPGGQRQESPVLPRQHPHTEGMSRVRNCSGRGDANPIRNGQGVSLTGGLDFGPAPGKDFLAYGPNRCTATRCRSRTHVQLSLRPNLELK